MDSCEKFLEQVHGKFFTQSLLKIFYQRPVENFRTGSDRAISWQAPPFGEARGLGQSHGRCNGETGVGQGQGLIIG